MSPATCVSMAVLGTGAMATLSVAFSWVFARRWGRPKRQLSSKTPADYALPHESVTFTSHGVALHGWLITPDRTPFSTVVLPHGWASNAADMLPGAARLRDEGFGVLVYDSRGHGTSGDRGPVTIRTFAEDLTAAVDHLVERPEVDAARLGIVGHSMGGAAAIVAASDEPRIGAVVSSSAFADIASLTRHTLRSFHVPRWPFVWLVGRIVEGHLQTTMIDLSPQNRIGQIRAPVLLLHGADDERIPPSDMAALYANANRANTWRVLFPDRGHEDIFEDPSYVRRIISFLHESLDHSPRNAGPEHREQV